MSGNTSGDIRGTTRRGLVAGVGAGLLAAPRLASAQAPIRWRMATSWPKSLPGPGVSARRLSERIGRMSGGRLEIQLFAAGEIVPAFAVLDAISAGTVEFGHTASFFWQGKRPAAAFFTTVPFGLTPLEHAAWIAFGDGQALWDELYRPFGAKAFLAGNTGPSMGGWFRREVKALSDIRGLRIRVQGLGGELYRRLGATPLAIPPGELEISLSRGVVDAAELLAPANDISLGLHRHAPFCHMPGFNKPNGAAEALVSLKAWEALPEDLKQVVAQACEAEHMAGLAEAEATNAAALRTLVERENVKVVAFPEEMMTAARKEAADIVAGIGATDDISGRIVASYRKAVEGGRIWASVQAVMARAVRG
jgi:TRAP-type mannitol/chloroaromatic compound transport system substrate-binding protein